MFCNETVPLARMQKMIYRNNEAFKASVEIAHFGEKPVEKAEIICQVTDENGDTIHKEIFTKERIEIGNCTEIGLFQMDLSGLKNAQRLTLEVLLANTPYKNRWDFWVYPAEQEMKSGNVVVTDKLDKNAEAALKNGGSVLLLNLWQSRKREGSTGCDRIFNCFLEHSMDK